MDKQGQDMFAQFILQRVQEGKEEEARAVLAENFRKQDVGTFSKNDVEGFIPKMLTLLKPDKVAEVQAVVAQFSGNFGQ
ncbi:hypothetical protein SAMN02799624_00829 [Paenibacillus sp. UNC496MF]|uniref:hypothetical protein n=1 Tax=Paenibacillus sp. UNC496MF TaxID=1502753 RepID=UPI0008DEAC4F|nr:hypothetical protein [Paenibacillus sp. UNC496MF]SFI40104.1 hypothetical protein SAMN02799624_00829 [Paenibacillus sp. UNC496MF]